MGSRRSVLRGVAVACGAGIAGCSEVLQGGPNPDVGRPELRGSLVGNGTETATVTVDVENTGPTGDIRVIARVLAEDGTVLDTYEQVGEIPGSESRTFEFTITPRADAETVSVRAVAE